MVLASFLFILAVLMAEAWGFSPGLSNCTISGTTIRVPVKIDLSPGFA
jgi:hypothetical protein